MDINTASEHARKTFEAFMEHASETISRLDERRTKEFLDAQIDKVADISRKSHEFAKNLDSEDIHNLAFSSIMIGAVLGVAGYSMEYSGSLELLMHGHHQLDDYTHGLKHQAKEIYENGGNMLTLALAVLKGDIMTHGGRTGMAGIGLMGTGVAMLAAVHVPELLNRIIPERREAYRPKYPVHGVGMDAASADIRKVGREERLRAATSYTPTRTTDFSASKSQATDSFSGEAKMITGDDISRNHKGLGEVKRRNQEMREQLRNNDADTDSGLLPRTR